MSNINKCLNAICICFVLTVVGIVVICASPAIALMYLVFPEQLNKYIKLNIEPHEPWKDAHDDLYNN